MDCIPRIRVTQASDLSGFVPLRTCGTDRARDWFLRRIPADLTKSARLFRRSPEFGSASAGHESIEPLHTQNKCRAPANRITFCAWKYDSSGSHRFSFVLTHNLSLVKSRSANSTVAPSSPIPRAKDLQSTSMAAVCSDTGGIQMGYRWDRDAIQEVRLTLPPVFCREGDGNLRKPKTSPDWQHR
jgi:hypothetical protein